MVEVQQRVLGKKLLSQGANGLEIHQNHSFKEENIRRFVKENSTTWGKSFELPTKYLPMDQAREALIPDRKVNIEITKDEIIFSPVKTKASTGIILFPGALVDGRAYAPLAKNLAENGVLTIISKIDTKSVITNKARRIFANHKNVKEWYTAGHSLGGCIASEAAFFNKDKVNGVIFLAANPLPLGNYGNMKFLDIRAENDKVLVKPVIDTLYKMSTKPGSCRQHVIKGANHANFGYYGEQEKDGVSEISRDKVKDIVLEKITEFIKETHKADRINEKDTSEYSRNLKIDMDSVTKFGVKGQAIIGGYDLNEMKNITENTFYNDIKDFQASKPKVAKDSIKICSYKTKLRGPLSKYSSVWYKFKSPEAIDNTLKINKSGIEASPGKLMEVAFEEARKIDPKSASILDENGYKFKFSSQDMRTGAAWVATDISVRLSNDKKVHVNSPILVTHNSIPRYGGMSYCKIFTPEDAAKIMSDIANGSFNKNIPKH